MPIKAIKETMKLCIADFMPKRTAANSNLRELVETGDNNIFRKTNSKHSTIISEPGVATITSKVGLYYNKLSEKITKFINKVKDEFGDPINISLILFKLGDEFDKIDEENLKKISDAIPDIVKAIFDSIDIGGIEATELSKDIIDILADKTIATLIVSYNKIVDAIKAHDLTQVKSNLNSIKNPLKAIDGKTVDILFKYINKILDKAIKDQPEPELPKVSVKNLKTPTEIAEDVATAFKNAGYKKVEILGQANKSGDLFNLAAEDTEGKVSKFIVDPTGVYCNHISKIFIINNKEIQSAFSIRDLQKYFDYKSGKSDDMKYVVTSSYLELGNFGLNLSSSKILDNSSVIYNIIKTAEWKELCKGFTPDTVIDVVKNKDDVILTVNGVPTFTGRKGAKNTYNIFRCDGFVPSENDAPPTVTMASTIASTTTTTEPNDDIFGEDEKAEMLSNEFPVISVI